jgi:hypothetical protein
MSFQGTAPLVSTSELTYFHTNPNAAFSYTVAGGLYSGSNTGGSFEAIYLVNASGAETDNVYTKFAVGNVSGFLSALMVGFVLDATHYFVASPGAVSGNISEVVFLIDNGSGQTSHTVSVSPVIPYNTATAFLTFYFAISGTTASVYVVNQTTGLITLAGSFNASAIVSAATLQTWSAGMYFEGSGIASFQMENYSWGPITDLTFKVVPNVVGDSQSVATAAVIAADLILGTVTSVIDPSTAGTILGQTPAAGTHVNFGTPVNITVSLGPVVPPRAVYGKFVGSPVFPPTLLIDAKGIKPRIYMPKENVTVKT